jgi:DNA repair ATPase RecN
VTEIRRGLSLITGEIGCGKRMLAEIRLLTEYAGDAS